MASTDQSGLVIIVGLGTAGLCVIDILLQAGIRIHAVDTQPDAQVVRAAVAQGFALTCGDGSDPHVLEAAGIGEASALLVLINNDAVTLRVGLTARSLCPDLRIVLRLLNHSTVEHLPASARLVGLSLAELVAPTFVAATLLPGLRGTFRVGDTLLGVVTLPGTTVSQIDPPLSASATMVSQRTRSDVLRDHQVDGAYSNTYSTIRLQTPEGTVLAGTPAALAAAIAPAEGAVVHQMNAALHRFRLWGNALAVGWQNSNQALRRLLAAVALVMLVGVIIFTTTGRLQPLEAFYFVVSTLTTVGYGDISVLHDPPLLILFDILLMLGGVLLMALVYAFITDLVVGAKIELVLGMRAAVHRNHVVIVGLGSVGYRCALDLHRQGIPTIALDPNESGRFWRAARAAGLSILAADAQSEDELLLAGITHARAVLCVTSNDQLNVEVGLLARGLNPDLHIVLRVFDPTFAAQVSAQFDIPATFSAAVIAAPAFAAAVLGHTEVAGLPRTLPGVAGVPLTLHTLPDDATLQAATITDFCAPGTTALAMLSRYGRCVMAPPPTMPLNAGDSVLVAGAGTI